MDALGLFVGVSLYFTMVTFPLDLAKHQVFFFFSDLHHKTGRKFRGITWERIIPSYTMRPAVLNLSRYLTTSQQQFIEVII